MNSAASLTGMSLCLEFTLLPKGHQTEPGPARLKKMGQSTDCPGKGAAHSLSHENYFEICRNLARLRL
jgi:hypothetical protein